MWRELQWLQKLNSCNVRNRCWRWSNCKWTTIHGVNGWRDNLIILHQYQMVELL
ncbi:hypothetical protein KHA80_03305 [Anaerobacillus sp. HL2]|nr:hypothetical protein KHA80_03305 [Anaerobacillus sp. HL2]